jgi:hypothetical protein
VRPAGRAGGTTANTAEVYDPAGNTWSFVAPMPPMPVPRHGLGGAVLGERILVPGGATVQGFGATAAHQVYAPPREKTCL